MVYLMKKPSAAGGKNVRGSIDKFIIPKEKDC